MCQALFCMLYVYYPIEPSQQPYEMCALDGGWGETPLSGDSSPTLREGVRVLDCAQEKKIQAHARIGDKIKVY